MLEPPRGKAGSEMETETFRSRIGSALSNRDYTDVETAWREYASTHPEDYEYLLTVASQLSRFEKVDPPCCTLAERTKSKKLSSIALTLVFVLP